MIPQVVTLKEYKEMKTKKDEIIADLLEALEYALKILLAQPNVDDMGLYQIQSAIAKAKE